MREPAFTCGLYHSRQSAKTPGAGGANWLLAPKRMEMSLTTSGPCILSQKQRYFLAVLLAFAMGSSNGYAQTLDKITNLKVEYWRSFDGLITIQVIRSIGNELTLNCTVTKEDDSGGKSEKHTVKKIKDADLAPVLTFFNYGDVRQFFAQTGPELQPDGANLSITVTQNSFSLTLASQYAFNPKATRYPSALGKIALHLFRLADVSIAKDKLY